MKTLLNKFWTYYWPIIKNHARRAASLWLYERYERVRGVIDPVKGDYDATEDLKAFEKALKQMPATGFPAAGVLPNRQDYFAANQKYFYNANSQAATNECVLYSLENQTKLAMLRAGLEPHAHIINKNLLYKHAAYQGIDQGTAHADIVRVTKELGIPIATGVEDTNAGSFARTTAKENVDNGFCFSIDSEGHSGKTEWVANFDHLVQLDKTLGEDWDMGITVINAPGFKYFGQREPFIKPGESLANTGAHKVAGVRGSMCIDQATGRRGFYVIESAYYDYEKSTTWHFMSEDLFSANMVFVRFEQKKRKTDIATTPSPNYSALASQILNIGDRGAMVTLLQKYLESKGFFTYIGKKGYYGQITAKALSAWLYANTGQTYTGNLWGSISQKTFKSVENLV